MSVAFAAMSLLLPFTGTAFIVGSSVIAYHHTRSCSRYSCANRAMAVKSEDDEYDATTAVIRPHLGRGLLRGVDPAVDDFYANEIDMSDEGLAWLNKPGLMWEAAMKDAAERGVPVEQYVDGVKANIRALTSSRIIYDKKELLSYLDDAFNVKGSFSFLLGAKNEGKSTILEKLTRVYNDSSDLLVLYVDARLCPGWLEDGLAIGLAALVVETLLRGPKRMNWIEELKSAEHLGRDRAINYALSLLPIDKTEQGNDAALSDVLRIIFDSALDPKSEERARVCQTLIAKFVEIAQSRNRFPVLIIDESNVVLGIERNDAPDKHTLNILTSIVSHTKQNKQLNVILVSSEHAYPYQLERQGFNLQNVGQWIFAGEMPPKAMWKLLVNATCKEGGNKGNGWLIGMGPHLAELCLAAYGGHIWSVKIAIDGLSIKQTRATASSFMPDIDSAKCLDTDPKSRPLLEAMAKYGFAPVQTPDDSAAALISGENVGGVVAKTAACIGISRSKWQATHCEFAVVPAAQCVRLIIAEVLNT